MLNELHEKLETVLSRLDVGGEQSRAFEDEIAILRELLGYPVGDEWNDDDRRDVLSDKLCCLAVEAEGIHISLPKTQVAKWLDTDCEDVGLAELLKFIADEGVRPA